MPETLAVIFDMDGVLVDSYQPHWESWQRMAAEWGRGLSEAKFVQTFGRTNTGRMYQTPKWNLYSYGAGYSEFAMERGQLHMMVADYNQNTSASNLAIPRQLAHLSDTAYLHVTYEVPSNATDRRLSGRSHRQGGV